MKLNQNGMLGYPGQYVLFVYSLALDKAAKLLRSQT